MSGIYIQGMEMPTSCASCRFSGFGGLRNERVVCMFTGANAYMNEVQYLDDCPLVSVPEHGRLLKVLKTERECVGRNCDRECGKCDLSLEQDEIIGVYDTLISIFDLVKEGEG